MISKRRAYDAYSKALKTLLTEDKVGKTFPVVWSQFLKTFGCPSQHGQALQEVLTSKGFIKPVEGRKYQFLRAHTVSEGFVVLVDSVYETYNHNMSVARSLAKDKPKLLPVEIPKIGSRRWVDHNGCVFEAVVLSIGVKDDDLVKNVIVAKVQIKDTSDGAKKYTVLHSITLQNLFLTIDECKQNIVKHIKVVNYD